jgi:putative nucleotidyltransferase with HDIG domain
MGISFQLSNLVALAIPMMVATLAFYFIETGLIAIAIALSEGDSLVRTWHERYWWLASHYVALGVMGLFMAMAYSALGILGVIVFTLPVIMMVYVQRQYVERTERSARELQRMYDELHGANTEVTQASQAIGQVNEELFMILAKIIDARDPFVAGHATKVAEYATDIAAELNLPTVRVERIHQAALLHDIGKVAISEAVLRKPGKLTEEEYEYFKAHCDIGADFLETSQTLRNLAPLVRCHHEHWDGEGYPRGLRSEQIPLEARVLAVADAVDAMASDRPYRAARSVSGILAELKRCAGTQFDPLVVEAFVQIIEREGEDYLANSAWQVVMGQVGNGYEAWRANGRPTPQPIETRMRAESRPGADGNS